MISAFCPAHITCFFQPVDAVDVLAKGSRGAGIRLNLGTTVELEERSSGESRVTLDDIDSDAPITKAVLNSLAPKRSFNVTVKNDLPTGQGFGMSASGAIAASLCVCELLGLRREEAFKAAHIAEVTCGGGLGDVSGLICEAHQPIRISAGLPPIGEVIDSEVKFNNLTLAVLGPKLNTSDILSDMRKYTRISEVGALAMSDYIDNASKEALFRASNKFSSGIKMESILMSKAIRELKERGIRSGMCMLGNSMFIDSFEDVVRDVLDDVQLFTARSTDVPARVIRKV